MRKLATSLDPGAKDLIRAAAYVDHHVRGFDLVRQCRRSAERQDSAHSRQWFHRVQEETFYVLEEPFPICKSRRANDTLPASGSRRNGPNW
jgi:hypothetical protein